MRFRLDALLCAALAAAIYAFRRCINENVELKPVGDNADLPRDVSSEPPYVPQTLPGSVKTIITSAANKRLADGATVNWRLIQPTGATSATDEVISLNPDQTYQDIVGFGAAFTDAACYMFDQLAPDARAKLFFELFHPSQTGLNVCRTCIGSSDYATHAYNYAESADDPEMTRFSIEHDRKYIIPILQQSMQQNPEMFLFSSPWSPPGWMKSNGSMLGGNVQRRWMPHYARYLLKFLQAYEAAGVPVQAITVQNEVDTDQDGNMPACLWPQEYEVDFVRGHLGPLFEREGQKAQIWMIDHNFNLWGRALATLAEPGVKKYARAIAWHGYVGDPDAASTVHDAHPDVDAYWTEGGPGFDQPDYGTDWTRWSFSFTSYLRNWCRGLTGWNLALDETGRPNIGPFNCGGLVTINATTKEISYSGQYWALAQFSKFIRRGARRFYSQGAFKDLMHVAFQNPDGSKVVVVTNSGPARTVSLQLGPAHADVQLEPDSVTTLVWN